MSNTIIISAGGTGGHVFPALCLARALKTKGYNIKFSTDTRGLKYLAEFANDAIVQDISTSSRGKLYISLLKNVLQSIIKLRKMNVSGVIGFGGYPSVPFVLAAQILGIKTIIHEQNAVIGKANKLLSKFAKSIVTSFPKTKGIAESSKVIPLGNPTRFESAYNNSEIITKGDTFRILIFGGSQGAKVFSEEVAEVVCEVSKLKKLEIFHQGRKEDLSKIEEKYNKAGINATVSDFFHNMDELYTKSDIVISRSGASSVFEIIAFQKPAILIPYMKSINGDQFENAKFLESNNAAFILDETKGISSQLSSILTELTNFPEKLTLMRNNLKKLKNTNTTKKFAELVEKTLYNKNIDN